MDNNKKTGTYIAHINKNGKCQTIKDHLFNVAEMSKKFASKFGAEDFAEIAGLTHDIGKYSDEAQNRIKNNGMIVDHSTAGGREILKRMKREDHDRYNVGIMSVICSVLGHHTGLPDSGTMFDTESAGTIYSRLKVKKIPEYDEAYNSEHIDIPMPAAGPKFDQIDMKENNVTYEYFSDNFWTRMLYSCLVDADFLDTENFMLNGKTDRDPGKSIDLLESVFVDYVDKKGWTKVNGKTTSINNYRAGILNKCISQGKTLKTGVYSLTVPTGGGKTFASLGFAIEQAKTMKKDRIIYVVPYCSIITQTVKKYKEVFGDENVLGHYSTADIQNESSEYLASENWDKPIIVTTSEQFFESLYACRSSKCRKLHNIVNSVVVFDEAQTIPRDFLKPCLSVIAELSRNYQTTCVLCTATQPVFGRFFSDYYVGNNQIIRNVAEIYDSSDSLYEKMDRVTYCPVLDNGKIAKFRMGKLAECINKEDRVLCIVNTRKTAKELYDLVDKDGTYHLSKWMTSDDIQKTIDIINNKLKNNQKCRVIATNLVEAGVDFDFPVVYRQLAGLDSIIQAGGRCNREGKNSKESSKVYIFDLDQSGFRYTPEGTLQSQNVISDAMKTAESISLPKFISRYFTALYEEKEYYSNGVNGDTLDKNGILQFINESKYKFNLKSIAEKFNLIESTTIPVLIPCNKEAEDLKNLIEKEDMISNETLRKIGKYCVDVKPSVIDNFGGSVLEKIKKGDEKDDEYGDLYILKDMSKYSEKTGLIIE